MSGSEGGPGRRTSRKAGTASRLDPYTSAREAQQVPGLVAKLVEAGSGRQVWHDVSISSLRSACQTHKGDRHDRCARIRGGLRPSRGPGGALSRRR